MREYLSIFVVVILVLSGLGAVVIADDNTDVETEIFTIVISSPIIKKSDNNYVEVSFEDTLLYLMKSGQPMLPKVVKMVELPFGIRNVKVEVTPINIQEYEIEGEIRPAPAPMSLSTVSNNVVMTPEKDEQVYGSGEPYPSTWFSYSLGCGLNAFSERVTHVAIHVFPVQYVPIAGKLSVAGSINIRITYENPKMNMLSMSFDEYDMVIIAPSVFTDDLQRLVDHKNSFGVNTFLKTTEEIYSEFSGVDKPEKIKYFIKYAIETFGVKYVLLFGGLDSLVFAIPRDDINQGSKDWLVPVRYNNLFDNPEHPLEAEAVFDPGVISDLYYADIYKEGGVFEDWDPNGDGVFAAMSRPGVENDTGIDMYPDVYVGRLACRNKREAKIVIEKIINYEQNPADPSWFNKMVVISGDGFLDQEDIDFQWDTNGLADGDYTIYAQSKNEDDKLGNIDTVMVTLDRSVESSITFTHDDHLIVNYVYPNDPVAEITSPSNGDILGNTDFFYEPKENKAYCNEFMGWANVSFEDGIMHIRGKTYDPRPYGVLTDIHVWIENNDDEMVFSEWKYGFEMYYEGEWITGERLLRGKGGALYYMPEDFEKILLWTSNGLFTGQQDVIDALSQGSGFVFFSGHGSPQSWGDHYPGVPGNRGHGSISGLNTIDYSGDLPIFPMNKLSNTDKPAVLVVGGCHNSQFNVSFLTSALPSLFSSMWTYWPVPECWSWWLVTLPKRGAIATIGNTGLGYGTLGGDCTIGGFDGGISLDFFRHYGELGYDILGEAYGQTITTYINTFDMEEDDHIKSVQQWVLLGDPSLKIGGYSSNQKLNTYINYDGTMINPGESLQLQAYAFDGIRPYTYSWDLDNDGVYDDATGEIVEDYHWDSSDVYWVSVKVTDSDGNEAFYDTIVDVQAQTPSKPSRISGSSSGKTGKQYTYTINSSNPNSDELYYLIEWGDGEYSGVTPEDIVNKKPITHMWNSPENYEIKVKAIDAYAQQSEWSDPLRVSISKNKATNTDPLFQRFLQQHSDLFPILHRLLQHVLKL